MSKPWNVWSRALLSAVLVMSMVPAEALAEMMDDEGAAKQVELVEVTTLDGSNVDESALATSSDDADSVTVDDDEMAPQPKQDGAVLQPVNDGEAGGIESEEDYQFEQDCDLLPGWGSFINGFNYVYVRNNEYPDGWHTTYDVTNVEVVRGRDLLEDFHYEDSDGVCGWQYRTGQAYGTVTFKVTYKDLSGNEQDYEFNVTIVDNSYHMEVNEVGDNSALPGESLVFVANGGHDFVDEYGYTTSTDEGLSYTWRLENDNDESYAKGVTLSVDENDSSRATVTFPCVDEYAEFDYRVRLVVTMYDGDVEVASGDAWAQCRTCYTTVTPSSEEFPSNAGIGESIVVTPRLLLRMLQNSDGQASTQTVDLTKGSDLIIGTPTFDIYYDSQSVRISGGTVDPNNSDHVTIQGEEAITIERQSAYQTGLDVSASWTWSEQMGGYYEEEHRYWEFNGIDCNVWFDSEKNPYSAYVAEVDGAWVGEATFTVDTNADILDKNGRLRDGYSIEWTVGDFWGQDQTWHEYYDDEYTADNLSVTVDAGAILNNYESADSFNVGARLLYNDTMLSEVIWYADIVREERTYDLPQDEEMLPGWETWVYDTLNCFVVDANHDHENISVPVTDVRVLSESPAQGVKDVISDVELLYDEGGSPYAWRYEALGHGTAVVQVSYKDLDGQAKQHTYNVSVVGDVFSVFVYNKGSDTALPGGSVVLWADGIHYIENAEAPNGQEISTEGLSYTWNLDELRDIEGVESVEVNQNDSSQLTITFAATPDHGAMLYFIEAMPRVTLVYEGQNRASGDAVVRCVSDYYEVWPQEIDRTLGVGESIVVKPEVRHYCADFLEQDEPYAYEVCNNAEFGWGYDDQCLSITAGADGTYTITRLRNWHTDFSLIASWHVDDTEYHQSVTHFDLNWVEPEKTYPDGWVDLPGDNKGYAVDGKLVTGWFDLNNAKFYFRDDGTMVVGWADIEVDGKLMHYYFRPSGNLARGSWADIDGKKYYFRPSGNMATEWADIDGSKYYFNNDGTMVKGWMEKDGRKYYFRPSGAMATGFVTEGDKTYLFRETGSMVTGWGDWDGRKYYATSDGTLVRGTWYNVVNDEGVTNRYYFRPSGSMATGWAEIEGKMHFFRPSGNMATGFADVPDDQYKRYFDEEGSMVTGWRDIGGNTYFFRGSGAMQTGKAVIEGTTYTFSDKGVLVS